MNVYKFLAANITACYMAIEGMCPDEYSVSQKLYLALAADLLPYVINKTFSTDSLKQAVTFGSICTCALFPVRVKHSSSYSEGMTEDGHLLGTIMQAECMIIAATSNTSARDAINIVIGKKEQIRKTIEQTRTYKLPARLSSKVYGSCTYAANMLMNGVDFFDIKSAALDT